MGRGLDGYFDIPSLALCSFEGPRGAVSRQFPVAMARGKHLFPFRTEPLSPSAPMVLGPQGPGRVGRRRFLSDPACAVCAQAGFPLPARLVALCGRATAPAPHPPGGG